MNPEQLLIEHQPLLTRLAMCGCRRKGLTPDQAEDFASMVNVKLIEDDYRVLRAFQNRAKLSTYLTVVVQRFLLDYLDHLWGKWRPSAAAKRLGPLAIRLERLTVRDGHSLAESIERILRLDISGATEEQLEELSGQLPVRYRRRIEPDDQLERIAGEAETAQERVERQEWEAARHKVREALQAVLGNLPAEDATIVRMLQTRTVAQIARALGLDQKPLYRRRDQLLAQVRSGLVERGIGAAEMQEYFRHLEEYR